MFTLSEKQLEKVQQVKDKIEAIRHLHPNETEGMLKIIAMRLLSQE